MGIAAYNRGSAAIAAQYADERRERLNRKTDRALWWRDLINEGHVLTFRDTRGTLTAGPYQTATGGYAKFAAVWWGRAPSAWRDVYACQAWDVALCVVEWFGRQRPILVDGERQ